MDTPVQMTSIYKKSLLMVSTVLILIITGSWAQISMINYERDVLANNQKLEQLSKVIGPLLSQRVDSELRSQVKRIQQILRFFDSSQNQLAPDGVAAFDSDSTVNSLFVFNSLQSESAFQLTTDVDDGPATVAEVLDLSEEKVRQLKFSEKEVSILGLSNERMAFYWRSRLQQGEWSYYIVLAEPVSLKSLLESVGDGVVLALSNSSGTPLLSINDYTGLVTSPAWELAFGLNGRNLASLSVKGTNYDFIKLAPIFSGLQIVAAVPHPQWRWDLVGSYPLSFWFPLIGVMLLVLLLLVPVTRAANGIHELNYALGRSLQGNFDVRVEIEGRGEVPRLAQSINRLLDKMSMAMTQLAQKIRLESEISTAKTVQSSLFPEPEFSNKYIRIFGSSEAASETGGDWWYYSHVGHRIFLWIGDATGHGASAALVTSAARAVSAVIEYNPSINVGQALRLLNRAIYDTSRGKMMMTFFLASFDPTTGILEYANASHDPPFRIGSSKGKTAEMEDFEPLNAVNNPRLGENRELLFKESSLHLIKGDRLVFYTDGIIEAANPMGKEWGERRFLAALAKGLAPGETPKEIVAGALGAMNAHRNKAPLDDDVTLVVVEWSGHE